MKLERCEVYRWKAYRKRCDWFLIEVIAFNTVKNIEKKLLICPNCHTDFTEDKESVAK
jgi:hypothetical protein